MLFPLLLILFKHFVSSGHIISYNVQNKWQNANYVQSVVLTFGLENFIDTDDYLMIVFPISVGAATATLTGGTLNAAVLNSYSNSLNYYFSGSQLSSNIIYTLNITIGTSPSSEGYLGIIKFYTVSDTSQNALIYDSNEIFGIWSVAPSPSVNLAAGSAQSSDSNKNNPAAQYTISISLSLGVDSSGFQGINFIGGSQIFGSISDSSYTLVKCQFDSQTCISNSAVGCTNISKPIDSNCSVTSQTFAAFINSNTYANQNMMITFTILNSQSIGSTTIDLYHTSKSNFYIFELKKGIPFATVNGVSVTVTNLKYLWGLSLPTSKAIPCPFGIYQPSSVSSNSVPVANNLIVEFQIQKSLSGAEFGIVVYFGPKSLYTAILEGSIYYTGLVPIANGMIVCSHNFPSSNDFGIVCRGIASFSIQTTYSIGARIFAKPYTTGNTVQNSYPKIQILTFNQNISRPISAFEQYTSFPLYLNADMVLRGDKNVGSYLDANSQYVMGFSWILAVQKPSTSTPITLSDQIKVLCLYNSGSAISLYTDSTVMDCSTVYKYGVFIEATSSARPNSILLFINGAKFSQGTFDTTTTLPPALFAVNTHIVHKIIMHKDFILENSKQFGLNLIGGILGNSASVSSSSEDCSQNGPNIYCYTSFNADDDNFANGNQNILVNNFDIYLYNQYDISTYNFALITVSCATATLATGPTHVSLNCAFLGASRTIDTKPFPAFEMITNEDTIEKASKSSLYPDENVRDMIYCMWIIAYSSVTNSKGNIIKAIDLSYTDPNAVLKIQTLLNFFHINTPISNTVSSLSYFINNACVQDSNGGAMTFNDENKIPLMFRLQFNIAGEQNYDAAAIFFGTQGNLQQVPTGLQSGAFSSANKPAKSTDLDPQNLSNDFNLLPTSTKAGSALKVQAYGYSFSGSTPLKDMDPKQWNYQPYILIKDGSSQNDLYVIVKRPSNINTQTLCANYFQIQNMVLAFLTFKNGSTTFYNVAKAYILYSNMKYATTGYYQAKNSLKIDTLLTDRTISGVGSAWNPALLFDGRNCQAANDMYPIVTPYVIGSTTQLSISLNVGSNAICKLVKYINGGYPGSAFTFTYLTSGEADNLVFTNIVAKSNSAIDTTKCAELSLTSSQYTSNGVSLMRQIFVCPFNGTANINLNVNPPTLEVNLADGVPWFWGKNVNAAPISILNQMINFGWSVTGVVPLALGQKYGQNNPNSVTSDSCVVTPFSPIQISSSSQKITWGFVNRKSDIIYPLLIPKGTTLISLDEQSLYLQDNIGSSVSTNLYSHECSFIPNTFSCSFSQNSSFINFKVTPLSTTYTDIIQSSYSVMNLYASYPSSSSIANAKHKVTGSLLQNALTVNNGNSEIMVFDCGTEGSDIPFTTARSKAMSLSNILFNANSNISSVFSFDFSYGTNLSFFGSSGFVLAITRISMGSLWNNLNNFNNVKCQIFNASNMLTGDFKTLEFSSPFFILTPKRAIDNPLKYTFKCSGGLSPSNSSLPLKIEAFTLADTLQNASSAISILPQATLARSTSQSLNVKFCTAGHLSIWQFQVSFANVVIAGSSMIYIVFPVSFAPKLTSQRLPACFFNNTLVLCEFYEERMLAISPSSNLSSNTLVNITIDGIDTPSSYLTTFPITIQLDSNNIKSDGILEWVEVQPATIYPISTSYKIIPLLYYDFSSTDIRSTFELRVYVSLPPATVVSTIFLYVLLPPQIFISEYIDTNLTNCILYNEYMDTLTNFVSNCQKVGQRIVKFTMKNDSLNSEKSQIYRIGIQNLLSPQFFTSLNTFPVIFFSDSTESFVMNFTSSGNANVSTFPSQTYKGNQLLSLKNSTSGLELKEITVYQGYFGINVTLSYPSGAISTGLQIQPNSTWASDFIIWQKENGNNQNILINSGTSSANFQMAASSSFYRGLSFLAWTFILKDPSVSNIAILPVKLSKAQCVITPTVQTNLIPISNSTDTFSLPIIFDFQQCMPVIDIGVKASISNSNNVGYFLNKNTYTLVNDYSGTSSQILIIVYLSKGSSEGNIGNVSFSLLGTNNQSYVLSPSFLTLNSSNLSSINSNFSSYSIKTESKNGSISFLINCNKQALIYYAFGIGISQVNLSTIISSTETKGIVSTNVNKSSLDATKMGWVVQAYDSVPVNISSFGDVKANYSYNFFAYCVSQTNIVSNVITTNWTQSTFFPKTAIVTIPLNDTPISADSALILNGICNQIKATQGQVSDYMERKCSNVVRRTRLLQVSSSGTFNYTVYIHPNLFGSSNDELTKKRLLLEGKSLSDLGIIPNSVAGTGTISTSEFTPNTILPQITFARINNSYTQPNQTILEISTTGNCFLIGCVYMSSKLVPNLTGIRNYTDGNSTSCTASLRSISLTANSVSQILLGPLSANTKYSVSFVLSTQNLGTIETQFGSINSLTFKTSTVDFAILASVWFEVILVYLVMFGFF